jgi:hypothetical protein
MPGAALLVWCCSRRSNHSKISSINAMDLGSQMLVGGLRSTVADDDIAIGKRLGSGLVIAAAADRCLFSGVIQTSHFKGVRTVFDPTQTSAQRISVREMFEFLYLFLYAMPP